MQFLHLNRGYIAIIDDCDITQLAFTWTVDIAKDSRIYATRYVDDQHLRLHVAIMQPPIGYIVDHKNRNGLDNRRDNLRLATYSQNNANSIPRKGRKYKGAYWNKRDQYWYSRIQFQNKDIYLGKCVTEIDAAQRYNEKALELFGEFARLNIIERPNFNG